ncbi:GAP1-N2 domain-containing protein [Mycolicibacterium sp. XJ870]
MTSRYGQLAYTSFDAAGSVGGWQVKETSGGLTPEETQLLLAGVRTVFRPVDQPPDFPTPEQLEQGPRRLAYRRTDQSGAAYWHTVPAGSDSTGRPGNVFAHVLLDRTPDTIPRKRAIEWWRSSYWLQPYGATAVARAVLTDTNPTPGAAVTKDSVVQFALDDATWRLATLFGLLDAVAAALDGGAPVAFGVQSADSAAQWIGLLSFLMSPGTAADLSFSTFDRADQVSVHSGQLLSAVPIADLTGVPPGVVAISETETLSLGELGGEPHRTAGGHSVAVTPWSAMAQVVMLDPGSARQLLDDIDTIAQQVRDVGLHPAWPMAMAVAGRAEFADAEAEAHEVIAEHSPPGIAVGSSAARTISSVLSAAVGTTTADAWQAVHELKAGPGAVFADTTYLCRAIADDDWLAQSDPIPLGPRPFHGKPIPPPLRSAIGGALAPDRGPDRLLRVIDLLLRAGVEDERLRAALVDDVVPHLGDPGLRQRIGAETRLTLGAALLQDDIDGIGIDDDLLDWLADAAPLPSLAQLSQALPWDSVWTSAALRGVRTRRRGPVETGDPGAHLWWLRVTGSDEFEPTASSAAWDPADLLLAAGSHPVSGPAAVRTLVGAPDSPAMEQLAGKVIDENGDGLAVACAAVRHIGPQTWLQQRYVETHQGAYSPLWDQVLTGIEPDGVHPDFATRILTFALLGLIAGQPYPQACNALAAGNGHDAVDRLLPMVANGDLTPQVVLAVSLLRAASAEAAARPLDAVEELAGQVAERIAVRLPGDEGAVDGVAAMMAQLSGDATEGALRGYRKMVSRLLARRRGSR